MSDWSPEVRGRMEGNPTVTFHYSTILAIQATIVTTHLHCFCWWQLVKSSLISSLDGSSPWS